MILDLLARKSDEDHPISSLEITEYLKENGITTDRKTLATDMKFLMSLDYDVIMIKSSPNKFFIGNRIFEVPELKLLIDAVSSSRFITEKKSRKLIRKLASLGSEPQAKNLKRHITATGRAKADNKSIYYIVDVITDAINAKRKIKFQYADYNGRKEKILRNDGEVYSLSPYVLYWNEDYYYVLGFSDKHENISAFRVDRLQNLEKTDERVVAKPKGFKVQDYAGKIFSMYYGEEAEVELECENSVMKYIIDRFGTKVKTEPVRFSDPDSPEGLFRVKVKVALTPTFYSWVFQFCGKMRIIEPKIAVSEFKNMAKQVLGGGTP